MRYFLNALPISWSRQFFDEYGTYAIHLLPMSEKQRDTSDDERKLALTLLKLGGAAVTMAALSAAAGWAGRRLRFEHTSQKYTLTLAYLESENADHHHSIVRRVAAASLLMPTGATPRQLRELVKREGRYGSPGEAMHNLVSIGLLEEVESYREKKLRPTQNFMRTLLEGSEPTPRLLAAAKKLQQDFEYESLLPYIHEPDVLDLSPFSE